MVRRRRVITVGCLTLGGLTLGGSAALYPRRDGYEGPSELRIATGPPGGVLRGIGAALADVLRRRLSRTRVWLIPTDASLDNLALLRRGEADIGFAALDAAVGASGGTGASNPRDLTACGRLFDSWMQILVHADSAITAPRQLHGRPIAAGAAGSGTRFGLRRLMDVIGISPTLVTASQDEGASALAAGSVDAFVTFSGVPTPAVTGLLRAARVRLLPLAEESSAMASHYRGQYASATLPATAYHTLPGTATFTTPNLLLARPDLAEPVVYSVTAALFDERATIARDHPEANQINLRSGVQTTPIRLHPGATRYFRLVKP